MGLGKDELCGEAAQEADLDCPICMGCLVDAVASPCGHIFCRLCIERALEADERCPSCRQGAAIKDLDPCRLINMRVNSLIVCCERRCGWYGRCDERRVHAKVCSIAKATEFTACVVGELGLNWENADGQNLVVAGLLDDGSILQYNKAMEGCPQKLVGVGCALVEANGIRGDAHELVYVTQRTLKRKEQHRLVFRRPTEFCTTISKHSNKWGLKVGVSSRAGVSFLIVRGVEEGAVMDHNRKNADWEVKSYDRIVEVNGCQGDPKRLLDCLQQAETCTMRILRFSP